MGGTRHNRLRENRVSGNGFAAAQNTNFGIGLISAGVNDNEIENNIVAGNTTGIFLAAGTAGNVIRKNIVTGNPAVQVAVAIPADGGDIRNLSSANIFADNVCLTGVNAPCPALGRSFTASPNPIPVTGPARLGRTTISWHVPDVAEVEVRIGSPNGTLFAAGGNRGSAETGVWVSEGMTFYLQDVSSGKPLNAANTMGTVVVRFNRTP